MSALTSRVLMLLCRDHSAETIKKYQDIIKSETDGLAPDSDPKVVAEEISELLLQIEGPLAGTGTVEMVRRWISGEEEIGLRVRGPGFDAVVMRDKGRD